MLHKDILMKKVNLQRATFLLVFLTGSTVAAPVIQGASGTFSHKGAVTITGSGFGTKTTAAPVVWDDASGTNILSKWSGAWPTSSVPSIATTYRTPMRGIALPHSNITRYIAGCMAGGNADTGNNVNMFKNRTISSYPQYTYASWYQRADNAWVFGSNNYKIWDYSGGNEPMNQDNWYLEYNPAPSSTNSNPEWHLNNNGSGGVNPQWGSVAVNPMSGAWSKVELEIRYDSSSNGYIKLYENGTLKLDYSGVTDKIPGTARTEVIGGYAYPRSSSNWVYYADVYLDYTLARVILTNNPILSKATVIEPQIPSTWNSNSINVSVNLGRLSANQTAYLFVIDSSGTPNTNGFPITVNATTGTQHLDAPTTLRIVQ